MGDLKENNMEVDESDDEKILARLRLLGKYKDKDGVSQFVIKSDDDSVIELAVIWSEFQRLLESRRIQDEGNVLQTLLRYTAWIIFDGRYSHKVNLANKEKLKDSFKCGASKSDKQSGGESVTSLERICNSLIPLSENPWGGEIIQAATSGEQLDDEAINTLWTAEGWVLLETRIEALGRVKNSTEGTIGCLLYVCASKGNIWTETDDEPTPNEVFDAFKYNTNEYCDLLEACVLFWAKNLIDIEFFSTLPIQVLIKTLTRLNERLSVPSQSRLLPRMWSKVNGKELCLQFLNSLLPQILRSPHRESQMATLYDYWLEANLQSTPEDEYMLKVKTTIDSLAEALQSVYSTNYIYHLASFLINKLKERSGTITRELYVELYLRGVVMDINRIEKFRAEISADSAKILSSCEALAVRLLELSNYFSEYKETSWNLLLTSFSLKPSIELFDKLFPSKTSESSEPIDDVDMSNRDNEDLHLPEFLCRDMSIVIFTPRWSALGRHMNRNELKENCKKLLEQDFSWLSTGRKNAELKYVNVNYEDYSHLPSKYDPNDDGIEKGFTRTGKRKPKQDLITKRRVNVLKSTNRRKGTVKLAGQSVNSGRGRGNWIKKPGGVKRGTTKGCFRRVEKNKTGFIKTGRTKSDKMFKVPKIPKKKGRKSKHTEVDEKLSTVKQYLRQTETVTKFFEAAGSSFSKTTVSHRLKKIKDQYRHAYCSEPKNIPGHVEVVPYPTAYIPKARGIYAEAVRTKPTGYIFPPSPLQLRLQDAGEFDMEFRINRLIFPSKLIDVYKSKSSKLQYARPSTMENILPDKSNYARWSMCADDFNTNFVSSEDKKSYTSEIMQCNRKSRPELKKNPQLEKSELIKLQDEYNKRKVSFSKHPMEKNRRRPCVSHVIMPLPEKEKESEVLEVPDPIQIGPELPEAEQCALNISDKVNSETTTIPVNPVKTEAAFIGDLVQEKISHKSILLPPGPKQQMESIRLGIMLDDSCKRVQTNLDCKTYEYPFVQKEYRKDQALLNGLDPTNETTLRRKRPLLTQDGPLTMDTIDEVQLQDLVASLKVKDHRTHARGEFSSRGRRRKLANCVSSCCNGAKKSRKEHGATDKIEDTSKKRFGKSYSRRAFIKKRKLQPQDASSDTSNTPDVNRETKSTSNNSSLIPNPNASSLTNSSCIVSKGASQYEGILKKVTTAEFLEALGNLPEPKTPAPPTGPSFGHDFALEVWRHYNENKNLTQIQRELKCRSWNPVNARINDVKHVDKVYSLLYQYSSTFREKLEERSKVEEPSNGVQSSKDVVTGTTDAVTDETKTSNGTEESQSKLDKETTSKPKFQVFFPLLHNPSIRRTGQLVAKGPIEPIKAPTITKQVLDELTGQLVDISVPAAEDEEDPNIKAALLIPWPDDKSDSEDDDHIRRLEDEHFKLLDEESPYSHDHEVRPTTPPPNPPVVPATNNSVAQKGNNNQEKVKKYATASGPKTKSDEIQKEIKKDAATSGSKTISEEIQISKEVKKDTAASKSTTIPPDSTPANVKTQDSKSNKRRPTKRKAKASNAPRPLQRKRKPDDSPEIFSEMSSSSTSSYYSISSSSSSCEEIVKQTPRPRSRRILRKRTNQAEDKEANANKVEEKVEDEIAHQVEEKDASANHVEEKDESIEFDLVVIDSSPTSVEDEECPYNKRRKLTRMCQTRRASVLLRRITSEEVEKYNKPKPDKKSVENKKKPGPVNRRPGLRNKKPTVKIIVEENVNPIQLRSSEKCNNIDISHSINSIANGVLNKSIASISAPIINPIEVTVPKKKQKAPSTKSVALTKDPLRSSYSPQRVIEEILLSSDDELVEVSRDYERTNGFPHLSQEFPQHLRQLNIQRGQEEHITADRGINGYSSTPACEYNVLEEPTDMIIAEERVHHEQEDFEPDNEHVDYTHLNGNVNNSQEDHLNNQDTYIISSMDDNQDDYIRNRGDDQEDFMIESENNDDTNIASPMGQTGSPEAILGLDGGDSSNSYNESSRNFTIVETTNEHRSEFNSSANCNNHTPVRNFHIVEAINNNSTETRSSTNYNGNSIQNFEAVETIEDNNMDTHNSTSLNNSNDMPHIQNCETESVETIDEMIAFSSKRSNGRETVEEIINDNSKKANSKSCSDQETIDDTTEATSSESCNDNAPTLNNEAVETTINNNRTKADSSPKVTKDDSPNQNQNLVKTTKARELDLEEELSQLDYDEEEEETNFENDDDERFQCDSDDSNPPPPYSPIGDAPLTHEILDSSQLSEPTPPLLTPEYQGSFGELLDSNEEISEPASPPRLHKYDVADNGI